MHPSDKVKVQVFSPKGSEDKIRNAIGQAGGGRIGKYRFCSFLTEGNAYFLPDQDTSPSIGKVGEITEVKEVKIEFLCDKDVLEDVIKAIKKVHPYEEVPIDIFPLLDIDNNK